MLKINCLVCEELITIPSYVDSDDYDGQVVCQNCTSLFHVKLLQKKIKKYEIKEVNFRKSKKLEEFIKELKQLGDKK